MRRIDIPMVALNRHEATLGRGIMQFLKRLAEGKPISWVVRGGCGGKKKANNVKNKQKRIMGLVNSKNCVKYFKWVYEKFDLYHILTARTALLVAFARENKNRFELLSKNEQAAVNIVVDRIFDYAKFREGAILLPPDKNWRIQWFLKPCDSGCCRNKRKRNRKTLQHEVALVEWNGWGIAEFVRLLDIRYCPYCNAETVGTATLPDRIYVPDIDHILPKSIYPLLSLSLYNLLPVCNRCNSRFKKSKDMLSAWDGISDLPTLHPYVHNIHRHIKFNYYPTSLAHLFVRPNDPESPLTVLSVSESDGGRGEAYIADYHLREIYRDVYSEEINEMIRTEAICSSHFEKAMKDQYGLTDNDFNRLFRRVSLNPCDINHFRFAKLVGDLHDIMCVDMSSDEKKCIAKKVKQLARRSMPTTASSWNVVENEIESSEVPLLHFQ